MEGYKFGMKKVKKLMEGKYRGVRCCLWGWYVVEIRDFYIRERRWLGIFDIVE